MSYTFPSATINNMTFTAKRWGQFPTITYTTGGTAGMEVVTLANDLSNITIQIQSGVSTNLQIQTAIANARGAAVQSLYAGDLVSTVIAGGHSSDTNVAVSATSLSGAVSIPAPFSPSVITPMSNLASDPSGVPAASSPTSTELSYLHGVTSALQTQLTPLETFLGSLASDPMSPTAGQIWYNTTSNVLKYYNGTAIKTVTSS